MSTETIGNMEAEETKRKHTICFHCFKEYPGDGPCPYCGYDAKQNRAKYPMALPPGTILSGHYIIGEVLGQGGSGITYLAMNYHLKLLVAIKEFFPEIMATRREGDVNITTYTGEMSENFQYGKECFLEEAKTLAKFTNNSHIVRVTGYFEENHTAYFVMDYLEGMNFKTYIKNAGGRISWEDAKRILLPVMEALESVHCENIIHRDVTPNNIFITEKNEVKLMDFGSSRYSLGDKSHSLDVVLTAGYAPKEQYTRRGKQGPFTDVYSVAACFYAALTGMVPPEALDRLDGEKLVPFSAQGVHLPEAVELVILKGLAVQAQDRFQTMGEFKDALLAAEYMPDADLDTNPAPILSPDPMPAAASASGSTSIPTSIPTAADFSVPKTEAVPDSVPVSTPEPVTESVPKVVPEPTEHEGKNRTFKPDFKKPAGKRNAKLAGLVLAGAVIIIAGAAIYSNMTFTKTVSYAGNEVYTGQIKHKKKNGDGIYTWSNGDVYEGSWLDDQMNGQGVYTWKNGDSSEYDGSWSGGKKQGYGVLLLKNGDRYEGEWSDDERNGHGTYIWSTGETYEGEWKDGKMADGPGIFTWADGTSLESEFSYLEEEDLSGFLYTGMYAEDSVNGFGTITFASLTDGQLVSMWKDGSPYGQGTFTWENGEMLEGEWSYTEDMEYPTVAFLGDCTYDGMLCDGVISGLGILSDEKSENQYVGTFRNGMQDGTGFLMFQSGSVYQGSWSEGQLSGTGTFYWDDTALGTLEGEWSYVENVSYVDSSGNISGHYTGLKCNDKRNGYGVYTWTNGNVYTGEWKDDKREGTCRLVYAAGGVYEGTYSQGQKDGHGTYTWEDGGFYDGEWKENKRSGKGTMAYANGNVYEGEWSDDTRNGTGTMTFYSSDRKEKDTYVGEWYNGTMAGQGTYTWNSGIVYTGGWKNGKRSGHGKLTYADGTVKEGEWRSDTYVKEVTGGHWVESSNGWWYQTATGGYLKSGWWNIGGVPYCFNDNGYLFTDTTTPDGYAVDKDGRCK